MIFGKAIMVEDNGGLTSKDNVKEDRTHPEYEYRMVSVSMTSSDVLAVTRRDISQHIFDGEPLTRGDYLHHKAMFEKDFSESRHIKVFIDNDSIAHRLYCLSLTDSGMIPVVPSKIFVSISEASVAEEQDIFCGQFYFSDENEKTEYHFSAGDNSLSISLRLDSQNFSRIFDNIRSGDGLIELDISFPAYADWLDSMSGCWPSTYIINTNSKKENFISINSISSTQVQKEKLDHKKQEDGDEQFDDIEDEHIIDLKDVNESISSITSLLSEQAYNAKRLTSYLFVILICLVLLTIKVYL
ncbi:hypothetical protein [Citrobacter portucalensis]|uniref:hypothetical protein n=1 Tax=Citrobacter portucalensis TaxID=1639133 RepID=UPI00226B132B|nr:hypothetical protein [Citrobacter portucalensis]MCX8985110.1 hypothetical protein [Citrobacter portucalensis]